MPINSIVSWLIKKRLHQMELFIKYPHEVQKEIFEHLIHCGRYTEWGKKHNYKSITNHSDFKKSVPVQDYDSLKPYFDRMIAGEQNVLWHTEINWFAKSSGTTSNRSKFIPVSREALEDCHYKGGKDLLGIYFGFKKKTKMYTGKTLIVGGSHELNSLNGDQHSYSADLSAIIINNLPKWVEMRRTPGIDIALMNNWEEKIEKMAESTMKENVVNISGVPSWTLVLLKRILEMSGKDSIHEVWPNLELYMHGGVSFVPYKEQFKELIGHEDMTYLETYNASEGFFGLQDRKGADDMLLMLDYGIFYEFIPVEELDNEHAEALPLIEVEIGKNYAMLISTNAGLWRYMIGDTVRFTSTLPYRFQISGRTKHFINTFGEELIIENAENALRIACERTGAFINDYTAGPIYMAEGAGAHEWLIEFDKAPENLTAFVEILDTALKSLNTDYEAKRTSNLILKPPVVRKLPQGTFYSWLQAKGKAGGQHKVPRLSNHRKFIDEVLAHCHTHLQHSA